MDMMRNFSPEMSEDEIMRKLRTDGDAVSEALELYFNAHPEAEEALRNPSGISYSSKEVAEALGIDLEDRE